MDRRARVPLALVAVAGVLASAHGTVGADSVVVDTAARTALTAAEAQEIVDQHAGPLDLSGIRELDPEVAVILGGYRGDLLLDGLTTLSVEAAAALASHGGAAGGDVDPHAIASRVAEAFEAGDLDGDRLAAIIGEFGGHADMPRLSLGGLESLDADVAAALAGHLGALGLDGLQTLGTESAQALAGHVGPLSLAGLENVAALPPEAVEALTGHVGEIIIPAEVLAAIANPPPANQGTAEPQTEVREP